MEKLIKDFEIPNKEIEAWKYTDLKRVFEKNNFEPFIKSNMMRSKSASIDSNISSNILKFITVYKNKNLRFSSHSCSPASPSRGLRRRSRAC